MKKFLSILMLVAALIVPWASRAQNLGDYRFQTGTDSTKWITLTSTTSLISAGAGDYGVSTVQNLGFPFTFAGQTYTQFSVNSDGNLRFGSTVTGTGNYSSPFNSSNAGSNAPKINPMGCDGYLSDSGHVYAELVIDDNSDSIFVIEFATSTYNTTSRPSLLRWQVQLHTNGKFEIVYPSTMPPILPNVTRQCGVCTGGNDIILINAMHIATHYTTGTATTIASGVWPDVNRYYSFTPSTCVSPASVAASGVTPYEFTITWPASSSASGYIVQLNDESPIDVSDALTYTFDNLSPDSTYIAYVASLCSPDDTGSWRAITVTTPPSCARITNLAASTTAGAAILTWTPSISDVNCEGLVEYRADTADTWTSLGAFQGTTASITGLDAGTAYIARVAALCSNGDTSGWQNVSFTTSSLPCAAYDPDLSHLDTIGNGTSTTSYFPTYSLYNYSYTQTIFTAAELGGAGNLNSIAVQCATFYSQRTTEIYIGHVSAANSSSWLNPSDLTLVYNGTTNYAAGQWFTFEFDTPFAYNGSDNLLIVFRDMTGSWTSSNTFYCHTGASSISRYVYQDSGPYTVGNPGDGYTTNNRPNMIFNFMACAQEATCAAPSVVVDSVSATEATVSWVPGYDETSWNLEYRVSGSTDWLTADLAVSNTTYTFTNLTPATHYDLRVVTDCGDTAFGSMVSIMTSCVSVERLQEDFSSYATGSSADFNECWTKNKYGTSTNYPYVTTIDNQNAMYFYGYNYNNSTRYYSWLITPEFVDSLNTLKVEFDMRRTSTSVNYTSRLIIGAVADPTNISQMDTIAVVALNNPMDAGVWMHQTVSLENYHGNGSHIVFLAPSTEQLDASSQYSYNYLYLDNLFIEPIDACPHPTRFHARDIMSTSAQLAWDGNEEYTGVTVKWSTSNSIEAATDSMVVSGADEYDLTGLTPNTTYYCWVTATCSEGNSFTMSCSFHTAATCNPVVNLTANEVSTSVATFSWSNDEVSPATSYVFSWKAGNASTWINEPTNNTFYMLNGLTEGTSYNVKVAAVCDNDNSTEVTLNVTTSTTGTIGNNDGTYYIPTYPYYNNSISEQLWLDNELSAYGDTIYGIYFNAASAISGRPMKIWVGNTTLTDLSTSSYVPSTDMTLVYNATANITAGWNEFHFTTPFVRTAGSNLVVMAYDSADYESFDGWITSNSAVHSLYDYDDEEVFSNTDLSNLTVVAARAQMKLNATLLNPTCVASHPVIASATGNSITIAWLPGSNETAWSVEYRGMTDTTWTVAAASTTDTFATVTNLAAATRYLFRISSLCSGETATATLLGRTACGAFTVPYTEDFNTMSTNDYVMNACWTKGTTGTGDTPYTVNITNEGMMSVMPRGSYIIFPTMDQPISDLQLRMRFVTADTAIFSVVGVCTHPGDIHSFTPIDTIWCEASGTATWTTTVFEDYTGTTGQIAIYSWYNQSYIDDINIELAPNCKPVTSITLANATTTSATLEWNAAANATAYILNYWIAGDSTVNTQTLTGTSVVLNGLQHSTTYKANLTTVCGVLGDTSLASNTLTFMTECAPVSLPYVQDFDHCNAPALTYTGILPNCWNYASLATGASYSTGSGLPQIYSESSYAHSGQYSLRMYGLSIVTLPEMPTSVDSLQISFHEYNTSTSYYGLIIGVCDSNTPGFEASFVPVDTLIVSQAHTDYSTYKLASYTGQGRYIAFKNFYITSSSTQYSTHYIDDVVVSYLPSCLPVLDVRAAASTPTSVDLTWTDLHANSEWQVAYSTHALTDPTTGIVSTVMTNPATITGLSGDSTYYFYVRTVCGAGDTSIWSAGFSVRPGTWNMRANQTDTITLCGGTIYDDGGASGNYSSSQTSYIILQPDVAGHVVTLNGTVDGEGSSSYVYDYLVIYDGIGTSGTELYNSPSDAVDVQSTTGPLTLKFVSDGSVQHTGFELHVTCVDTNCMVKNLRIDTSVITNSTQLALTWNGGAPSYEVQYGDHGFTLGSGTTVTTQTNSIVLNSLTPLSSYDVYVRAICSSTDTSAWATRVFATAMCETPTLAENFDTSMVAGSSSYSPIGYAFYNYSYTQTIIDAADLAQAGITEITAMAFHPASVSAGTYFNHIDVYLANVSEDSLVSGFIRPDATHTFVQVIADGNFVYTDTTWQNHAFDNSFTWDGQSNVLVAVNRKHGSYASGASFRAHTATVAKTRYAYQDGSAYNINSVTVTSGTASNIVGDIRLLTCGAGCPAPAALTASNVTYNAATITWSGSDSTEVGIHQGLWDESGATMTNVTPGVHTYTFTGLTPNTQYTVAARTLCEDDMTSNWTYVTFTTDDLPCFAPTNVQVSNETPNGAKVTWTAGGNETEWVVNVFRSGVVDTNYTVINTPMCNVSGLYSAMTYTVKVGAVCGGIDTMWSETTTLTTTACLPPTNVTAVANGHQAIVTWEGTGANEYHVLWFLQGFTTDGDSVIATNGTTNATIDGLQGGEDYDIYVYAYCDGQRSAQAGQTQLHVTGIDDINTSAINLYPNPANTTVTVDGIEGEALVTIVDMNGRTVFSEKTVSSITIDLNGMAKGAYFVRITGENSSAIRKLIVK